MKINIPKKTAPFVPMTKGGNFTKKHNERLDFLVSTWVSFDTKRLLHEIAYNEQTTVSEIARRFLEKGISEYKEANDNGN